MIDRQPPDPPERTELTEQDLAVATLVGPLHRAPRSAAGRRARTTCSPSPPSSATPPSTPCAPSLPATRRCAPPTTSRRYARTSSR